MIISCLSREENRIIRMLITYRAKFVSADRLRQRIFFHNHEGTFGNRGHDYLILVDLKLLSNEVIAKISCRSRFSATMASCFVEADEEFNEELRNISENKNTKTSRDYRTNIFQQWAKTRGKMSNLKATKYQSLTKRSPNFLLS